MLFGVSLFRTAQLISMDEISWSAGSVQKDLEGIRVRNHKIHSKIPAGQMTNYTHREPETRESAGNHSP